MWNTERIQLQEDLNEVDVTFGCVYSKAVELIDAYLPEVDSALSDASLIGHAVCELIYTLPHYLRIPPCSELIFKRSSTL